MSKFIELVKKTVQEWSEDKASRLAAALAYYTTFSLAPLLVLIISLLGLLGYRNLAESQIMAQVEGLVGPEGRDLIATMIETTSLQTSAGVVASIISLVTLLFGALGVFGQLQDALNTIWEVAPRPSENFWATVKSLITKRLLSFSMILVVGFLLLVSLVLSSALAAVTDMLGNVLPLPPFVLQGLDFLLSFAVITVLFALIYKVFPDAEAAWKDVLVGAAVTSLLFTIGKFLIGLYLGRSDVSSAFGAAGSLVILLLWIYYSAQVVFLGAEFTQVYAHMYGSGIRPDANSILLTEEARAHQGLLRHTAPEPSPGASSQGAGSSPLLAPTGAVAVEGPPLGYQVGSPVAFRGATEQAERFNYVYRERKGFLGKLFYGLLMASQLIPSVKTLAEARSNASTQDGNEPHLPEDQAARAYSARPDIQAWKQ